MWCLEYSFEVEAIHKLLHNFLGHIHMYNYVCPLALGWMMNPESCNYGAICISLAGTSSLAPAVETPSFGRFVKCLTKLSVFVFILIGVCINC